MKKAYVYGLVVIILGLLVYGLYYFYLPELIAKAIVADDAPAYIPKRIQNRIDEFKEPINKGAEDVVLEIHRANIPMKKVLETLDQITEEQIYDLLDDLQAKKITSSDDAFNVIKKHIHAEFDLEKFRKPFTENVSIKEIRKWITYAKMNRQAKEVDIETTRMIIKKVLIEKEREYKRDQTSRYRNTSPD